MAGIPPGEQAPPQGADPRRGRSGSARRHVTEDAAPAASHPWRGEAARARVEAGTGYFSRLSTAAQSTFLKKASTYLARSKAL